MISAQDVQYDVPQQPEDHRDEQLRLYREIGISAVAAVLNVGAVRREPVVTPSLADIPAVLRGDDLAA